MSAQNNDKSVIKRALRALMPAIPITTNGHRIHAIIIDPETYKLTCLDGIVTQEGASIIGANILGSHDVYFADELFSSVGCERLNARITTLLIERQTPKLQAA